MARLKGREPCAYGADAEGRASLLRAQDLPPAVPWSDPGCINRTSCLLRAYGGWDEQLHDHRFAAVAIAPHPFIAPSDQRHVIVGDLIAALGANVRMADGPAEVSQRSGN